MTSKKQKRECHTDEVQGGLKRDIDFDKFRSFVDHVGLRKKMKTEGCLHGLNIYITESLKRWPNMALNIAITGGSGVGKSSLINALRNLKPLDKGAAAVGVVETTTKGKRYTYPENPNVALWDLPGMGTKQFKGTDYLTEMKFERFDVVIIVSAGRFFYNDSWLGKELRKMKRNVIFVRTKIDEDIRNAERDNQQLFNKEECLKEIRNDLLRNISDEGDVFMVSSPYTDLYDFGRLDKKLKDMLSIRGKAISFILQEHFEVEMEILRDATKNENTFYKLASAVCGLLPLPTLETYACNALVEKMYENCLKMFCIDNNSLDEISKELGIPKTDLKKGLKSYEDNKETLFDSTEQKMFSDIRRYLKYFVPVVGSLFSAHKTYVSVEECLNIISDNMAADARKVALLRLDRLRDQLKPL